MLAECLDYVRREGGGRLSESDWDYLRASVAAAHDAGLSKRAAIAAEHGGPGHWWWTTRPAKSRDLAVLSLIAGNFPELDKPVGQCLPLDVVRAEQRAINHARQRFALESDKDHAPKIGSGKTPR